MHFCVLDFYSCKEFTTELKAVDQIYREEEEEEQEQELEEEKKEELRSRRKKN